MRKSFYLSGLLLAGLTLNACQQAPNNSSTTPVKPGDNAPAATADSKDTAPAADVQPANNGPKNFPVGIVVPVGVIGYRVAEVEYPAKLTDGSAPEAGKQFVRIFLGMRNTGNGEAPIGTLKLVDGKNEYNLSAKGQKEEGSFYGVKTLAKDEYKKGVIVFEAPKAAGMKLKINSITPVKDEMFIELDKKK
jgi:hypothetical protein